MKTKKVLKKVFAWLAAVAMASLTYLGAVAVLGQIWYNDWRILFIACVPATIAAVLTEGAIDR